ncbi:threonine/serine exporter family protein [Zwartia sp.]|uniref:threonine/serine ThrE exporter family protein n=1 Tax=Zwartia sp. TaxID=2978004 RepID=UPI002724E0A7|nr:threonine/serine exporter family protein [Zwartia sp.]MDO9025993.1 threonine/serine exporter family protein [Zwartia sp.]
MTDRISNVALAATLLHANGQTTQRVISATTRLAEAYGYEMRVLPQWDVIIFRFRDKGAEDTPWQTEMVHVRPTGVDMNKVALTTGLIDQVASRSGVMTAEQLSQTCADLQNIAALKPSRHPRFILMAGVGASALGVIFGVTSNVTLALIFFAAVLGASLRRWLASTTDNLFIQPFIAALVAGLVGGAAQRTINGVDLQFVDIAPCMILVPGAHILNAALDLVRGRLSLGVARLAYCGLILLAICAGLLIGLVLTSASLAQGTPSAHVPLWLDIISAGLAVAAFGAFFSLPWKVLIAPIAVGMVCHASRWWILDSGGGVALGAFVACLIAGTVTALLARFLRLPFAALAFSAVVSMMPGIFLFKFASGVVDVYLAGEATSLTVLTDVVSNGTASLLIVMVMTFGLIFPKMLIDGWLGADDLKQ